ncbi:type IV secretion system protein [Sphingomonas immobilis]|uniref:Type IV secretion system protein n=1 Tax=Sphingomonas immobilis TaxID=3063997 RepID=A0ABT8ZZX6_9SPHN|nr:type IV secretion system protein [Sphingomonas sp. CA1-15]MDO7843134.1 type IV secretion system protein [Sphingomonas sp. CA1-15]
MADCPALSTDGAFVVETLAHIDCQAQGIGAFGYQALATPGSPVAVAMTGLLTLFVALFGYRMLFGQAPGVREAVMALVKIGVVLALATSWPAYRTVFYDLALRAPAELAAYVGGGLPGAGGALDDHLGAVDDAFAELVRIGSGKPPNIDEVVGPSVQPLTPAQQAQAVQHAMALGDRPRWDRQRDQEILAQARTVYLAGAIGSLAGVRLVAGLLLALGPLFALFLLFDTTRGLFDGWVRALGAAALGGLTAAVLLGVELAILEPWLAAIMADRQADLPTPAVPIELLALTIVFALALLAGLAASVRIASGFRLPVAVREASSRAASALHAALVERHAAPAVAEATAPVGRDRARAIADAVATSQRRDAAAAASPRASTVAQAAARNGGVQSQAPRDMTAMAAIPIGQSARRRTSTRISAGAGRRDAQKAMT